MQAEPTYRLPDDLYRLVNPDLIYRPKDLVVACYTFPHYHRSALNDRLYGEGWTEYVLMRGARPWFPGHDQPRTPLLGELDERQPSTWERYIDLATGAGIHVFIFDWYWYAGMPALHEALEEGFLGARNRGRMQFAVMWVNHSWAYWFPTVGTEPRDEWGVGWEPLYDAPESAEEVWRSLTYIIARYFHLNYWKIAGKPVLPIWDASRLIRAFGMEGTRNLLDELRAFAQRLGHEGIHFHAVCHEGGMQEAKHHLAEIGVDSYGLYNTIAEASGWRPREEEILDCRVLAADVVTKVWPTLDNLQPLPCFPTISPGCDGSPRFAMPERPAQPDRHKWPGTVIAINDHPHVFEALARAALGYLNARPNLPPVLLIGSWNEWTEGHYLLPDTRYGFGMLRALARALQ